MKFHYNAARWTTFIFGFLAFALDVITLKSPKTLLKQMGFKAVQIPVSSGQFHKPLT